MKSSLDFGKRSAAPEIMDDLLCDGEVVFQTLRELDFINRWLGGNNVTLQAVGKLLTNRKQEHFSIADLGCGSGDMLKRLSTWGKKQYLTLSLTGIDANPNIIAYAKDHCKDAQINFEALDIFSEDFRKKEYDVIIGTLFYHHFSTDQLIDFFSRLRTQARVGIIINDIHRHWLAYRSIKLLTGMFSKSAMVRYDAPLSVLRAFSRKELEHILRSAGFNKFDLNWKWAFRWQVVIETRK